MRDVKIEFRGGQPLSMGSTMSGSNRNGLQMECCNTVRQIPPNKLILQLYWNDRCHI
jgi:hypothetical protein